MSRNSFSPSNGSVWGIIFVMIFAVMIYASASGVASQIKSSAAYSQVRDFLTGPNVKLTAMAQITK